MSVKGDFDGSIDCICTANECGVYFSIDDHIYWFAWDADEPSLVVHDFDHDKTSFVCSNEFIFVVATWHPSWSESEDAPNRDDGESSFKIYSLEGPHDRDPIFVVALKNTSWETPPCLTTSEDFVYVYDNGILTTFSVHPPFDVQLRRVALPDIQVESMAVDVENGRLILLSIEGEQCAVDLCSL